MNKYYLWVSNLNNYLLKIKSNLKTIVKIKHFTSGVPADLIRDYNTLMTALTCGADISPSEFEVLAESWLDRFHDNEDLNWNILAPTVHLVLQHGRYLTI